MHVIDKPFSTSSSKAMKWFFYLKRDEKCYYHHSKNFLNPKPLPVFFLSLPTHFHIINVMGNEQ